MCVCVCLSLPCVVICAPEARLTGAVTGGLPAVRMELETDVSLDGGCYMGGGGVMAELL